MNTISNIYKELTENEIKNIVKKFFNDNLLEYRLLKGGLFNTTYFLQFENNKKYVLRVGPVNRHLLMPFEHNLMNAEDYFYNLCKEENIPVSNVVICDTSKNIIERDYMIVEYIESIVMSEANLTKNQKDFLYEEIGRYAYKIQNIKGQQFGRLADIVQGNGFNIWGEYLKSDIEKITNLHLKYNILNIEQVNNIKSLIVKYENIFNEITIPRLTHCDLWEGNILLDKNDLTKIVAIIDGDRAIFGDEEYEFGSPYMINEHFIKGYGRDLDMSNKGVIKRKIYWIAYNLLDCYVWFIQYNNAKNGQEIKDKILKLVEELL